MRAFYVGDLVAMRQLRVSSLACAIVSVLLLSPSLIAQQEEEAATRRNVAIERETVARRQQRAALEELERQKQVLMQQHMEAERQRQRAEEEFARQREDQAKHAARIQEELQRAQAQLAELAARRQEADPLPEDVDLKVFHLQHVGPHNLAEILSSILRNNTPRIAVDERTNALLVAGTEKQLSLIEALAQKLDRPAGGSEMQKPDETLQVRVVWLLDINEGMDPNEKLVSPQVVDALGELGFQEPKVICQQVTTLTLNEEDGSSRRGRFNFSVPVLIQSQPWYFEGHGQIEPLAGDRFNLQFEMQYQQHTGEGRGRSSFNEGKLGGSIYTPLGHYTVMGTTTFVAQTPVPTPFDKLPGDSGEVVQNQHLSAFVVYLDRAKEFPAPNTFRKSEGDE
jgi:type II secretory pathway component GspD/PulD (secretin)